MYEKLIEALRLCLKYGKAEDALANASQAADAIEELTAINERQLLEIAVLSKPKWIPVTERLPENGYYVLAYEDGDILMASYAGGNWVLRDMFEVIDDLKPTYWMPLPDPPKEE